MPSILTPQNQSMATTSSSSSSAGQFARLAMASKILCDRELIEARQEIESLKLQLFWMLFHLHWARNDLMEIIA